MRERRSSTTTTHGRLLRRLQEALKSAHQLRQLLLPSSAVATLVGRNLGFQNLRGLLPLLFVHSINTKSKDYIRWSQGLHPLKSTLVTKPTALPLAYAPRCCRNAERPLDVLFKLQCRICNYKFIVIAASNFWRKIKKLVGFFRSKNMRDIPALALVESQPLDTLVSCFALLEWIFFGKKSQCRVFFKSVQGDYAKKIFPDRANSELLQYYNEQGKQRDRANSELLQ